MEKHFLKSIRVFITFTIMILSLSTYSFAASEMMSRDSEVVDGVTKMYAIGALREKDNIIYNEYTNYGADKIRTITIVDLDSAIYGGSVPTTSDVIDSWDISSNHDSSVMAWLTNADIANETQMYNLYLAGKGGIKANNNSAYLFASYTMCTEIKNLNLLDTTGVTNLTYLFRGCNSLTSIDISNIDVSAANFGAMFMNCSSLESIDISSFDTSNTDNFGELFRGCSSLETIDLSNIVTSNVTNMNNMFYGCSGLTFLNLSGFDTSNVNRMEGLFSGCSALKFILLGKNFDRINGKDMFVNCSSLVSIIAKRETPMTLSTDINVPVSTILYLPNTTAETEYEAVTDYNTLFGENRIKTLTLELIGDKNIEVMVGIEYVDEGYKIAGAGNETNTVLSAFGYTVSLDENTVNSDQLGDYVVTYTLRDGNNIVIASVTRNVKVSDNLFIMARENVNYIIGLSRINKENVYDINLVKSINFVTSKDIPSNAVESWDVSYSNNGSVMAWLIEDSNDGKYDFYIGGGSKICTPYDSTSLLAKYAGCSSITGLELLDTSRTVIMDKFFNDNYVKNIDVTTFDVSNVTSAIEMFSGCRYAEKIDVSGWNTSKMQSMRYLFNYCLLLNKIDVSGFDTSNVTDMYSMFGSCNNLKSLDLSNFDTSKVNYMSNMFFNCRNLKYIFLGENFDRINGKDMFKNCNGLVSIIAQRETPMTLSDDINVSTSTILYVSNTTVEIAYETATNYSIVFGENRIKTVTLELIGDKNIEVMIGTEYADEGYEIAGAGNDTNIVLLAFGLNVNLDENTVNSDQPGDYVVTYTLKNSDNIIINSVTRNVKVVLYDYLMQRESIAYVIGASRAQKTTYTSDKINSITIVDRAEIPSGAVDSWDVSYSGDGSVVAYLKESTTTGLYDLYIGSDNQIVLPEVSSNLFAGYTNCKKIDGFEKAFSHRTKDFTYFFQNNAKMESVDITHLDTSNGNLGAMFKGCSSLKSIDLSNFDTSNATSLGELFSGCKSLEEIDITNFETTKCKYFNEMFLNCSSLKLVDISSFNLKNGIKYQGMFSGCVNLKAVLLGNNIDSINYPNIFSGANCGFVTTRETLTIGKKTDIGFGDCILYVNNNSVKETIESDSTYSGYSEEEKITIKPLLTLNGKSSIQIGKGSSYVDDGACLSGISGNDLSLFRNIGYIVIEKFNTLDLSAIGKYEITYALMYNNGTSNDELDTVTRNIEVVQQILGTMEISNLYVDGYSQNDEVETIDRLNWYKDTMSDDYYLFLPKVFNRSNLKAYVMTNYSDAKIEIYSGDTSDISNKLGEITNGELTNLFLNDTVIIKVSKENYNSTEYTLHVMQSTLPSLFISLKDGDEGFNLINSDRTHETSVPGIAMISDENDKVTNANISKMKGRGNFTWTCTKKPYQLSFESKISMLGMPKSKKWLLITNYTEGSMSKSAIFYELAQELGLEYAIDYTTADIYINNKYQGTYLVTSKVEQGSNRVNITDEDFLLEIDNYIDVYQITTATTNTKLTIKSPDLEEIEEVSGDVEVQRIKQIIKDKMDAIEAMIMDTNVTYSELEEYLDMDSFARFYWIQEISENYDAMYGSSYLYSKDGKIHMGPIWDMDNSLNMLSKDQHPFNEYYIVDDTRLNRQISARWYVYLMQRKEFSDLVDKIFLENAEKIYGIYKFACEYIDRVKPSVEMNYVRWPYSTMKSEHSSMFMGGSSYEEAVAYTKTFLKNRLDWYKTQYLGLELDSIKYKVVNKTGQEVTGTVELNDITILNSNIEDNAEITLIGIYGDNQTRDLGTVLLTDGIYSGDKRVSNATTSQIKTENSKLYNLNLQLFDCTEIILDYTNVKKEYKVGEEFNPTGLIVTAKYNDGTDEIITNYGLDKTVLKLEDTKVVVSYMGRTADIDIVVRERVYGTLKFNTNGGTAIEDITQEVGTEVVAPANPTKEYYEFDCWDAEIPTTMPSGEKTINANWKAKEYEIVYELDDGEITGTNPVKYTIESGDITLINPTKAGYRFKGWTGTDLTEVTETVVILAGSNGNRTYTANYEKINNTNSSGTSTGTIKKYSINVSIDSTKGSVSVSNTSASKGKSIIFTINPEEGYEVSSIRVLSEQNTVTYKELSKNKYEFLMPSASVKIEIEFSEDDLEIKEENKESRFDDVKNEDYFYLPVEWAADNNITTGVTEKEFKPYDKCTRAQTITFLWIALGSPKATNRNCEFEDITENDYFYEAVLWAAEKGITKGVAYNKFGINETCTRAQVVTFLFRLTNKNTTSSENKFTDVNKNDYFYLSVNWASENNITYGTSDISFSPNEPCLRGQIITFIYRWNSNCNK